MANKRLIFVYNADSGLLNTALDIAHKIFSPKTYQCQLCALTHDHFHIKQRWQDFIAQHQHDFQFLHRDEFLTQFPANEEPLPAIFEAGNGDEQSLHVVVDKQQLALVEDADALIALIERIVSEA